MPVLIHSARVVSDFDVVDDGWVLATEGHIAQTGTASTWRRVVGADTEVIDASAIAGPGAILAPGLIDLHCHGGGGGAAEGGVDGIGTLRGLHRAHGTTRQVISLVTGELDALIERVSQIAHLTRTDPEILGSHLEGPFLDPGHKGAHEETLLIQPSADAVGRLLAAGLVDGRQSIRQITLAPELPGALEAIERFCANGVRVAIGHTDADADTTRRAIDAGASLVTHAFNAMRPIHHRQPGPVPVAAADERVTLEVILDGVHVHEDVARMLFASAPGRVVLVTDAMVAAGMPDGTYQLGALDVNVDQGVARLRHGSSIAGSTLTMDRAVGRAVAIGVPLADAFAAATTIPARVLGEEGRLGTLALGAVADITMWRSDMSLVDVRVAMD